MTDSAAIWAGLTPPYRTIVADPPWPSRSKNAFGQSIPTRVGRVVKDRRPDAHYSTMTLVEIAAMPVVELADPKGAHLYLWATNSGLHDALHVMEAWGFGFKTALTWVKQGHLGIGYYFRNQTEHVLFGVRGTLPTGSTDQRTVLEARKAGHSIKPQAAFDVIEISSPGPYVELFARAPRLGWDHWGYGYETEGTAV